MKYLMFVAIDPYQSAEVDETGTLPVDEWVEKNDAAQHITGLMLGTAILIGAMRPRRRPPAP